MLEEASQLYSSINVKDSISNHEFSIASITNIVLEEEKNEDIKEYYDSEKQQKDQQQLVRSAREHEEQQQQTLPDTVKKYECTDCNAIFDTPAGHRKHYQAFHGSIEDPNVIEKAEI